jgi:adenylate kinase family enzyme
MKRINVVGASGSGKTTFSKELAQKLNIEYIEMDRLYWKNDWRGSSDLELLHSIRCALIGDAWVLDGNYNRTQAVKWKHLDTLIWLDFPFYLVFYRVLKRAIKRAITKEKLWDTNNYENFKLLFAGAKNNLHYKLSPENEVKILKAQRKSIGGIQNEKISFENQEIILPKGSVIYLSSDGFIDQNNFQRKK